jgi:hypothetical protein
MGDGVRGEQTRRRQPNLRRVRRNQLCGNTSRSKGASAGQSKARSANTRYRKLHRPSSDLRDIVSRPCGGGIWPATLMSFRITGAKRKAQSTFDEFQILRFRASKEKLRAAEETHFVACDESEPFVNRAAFVRSVKQQSVEVLIL